MMKLARYYHTLKYLKLRQIYWRIHYRFLANLRKLSFRVSRKLEINSARNPVQNNKLSLRNIPSSWQSPVECQQSLMTTDTMVFLNQEHNITSPTVWNDPTIDKLWLYNLHYFSDLNAIDACQRQGQHVQLIKRWISENSVGEGCGWEPFPTSLRIVNWIKWSLAGNVLDEQMLSNLYVQTRVLRKRLEYHLLGNHLLANAKALIFSGLFFAGAEAGAWYKKGMWIIKKEIDEQILPDGGHFELSPMYHSLILEDLLDLVNILRAYSQPLPEYLIKAITKMFVWLQTMLHPDNQIALFNDAAFGIAPTISQLTGYAQRLELKVQQFMPSPVKRLLDSGFMRLENATALLIADVGNIGPDYLPGHAHADTLSFELSLNSKRVIVNSGTSCYGLSAERSRQRSTEAHNTIVIDNLNSSDVWSGFRVGARAKILRCDSGFADETAFLSAAHDGYKKLGIIHQRNWKLKNKTLIIIDELIGNTKHEIKCVFHFHPDVQLHELSHNHWSLRYGDGLEAQINLDQQLKACLQPSTFHPEFGVAIPNGMIMATVNAKLPLRLQHEVLW